MLTLRRSAVAVLVVAMGLSLAARKAASYEMSGAGVGVGYANPDDANGAMAVRGQLEFVRPDTHWQLQPNVMYFRSDDLRDLSANADACYHFPVASRSVSPYLGAGLGLNGFETPRRSETALGANLVGGFKVPMKSENHVFVESRVTVSDFTEYALMGGITFHTR